MVKLEDVDKLKVNELKAACKELGLEQGGNKAELAARLKAALAQQEPGGDDTAAAATEGAAEGEEGTNTEAASAAAAAVAEPSATKVDPPADAAAVEAAPAGDGKQRAKIAFSETEAARFESLKVQVVNAAPAPADKPKQLSEEEKLRQRKDRFKDPETERKKQRAQRFNLIDADLEKDKMMKRAERFGTNHPELEKMKKEQRAARFGIVDEETKKKQRLDKFKPLPSAAKADFNVSVKNDGDFEAKRQARAARFAAS